jgi:hypothetical protein
LNLQVVAPSRAATLHGSLAAKAFDLTLPKGVVEVK